MLLVYWPHVQVGGGGGTGPPRKSKGPNPQRGRDCRGAYPPQAQGIPNQHQRRRDQEDSSQRSTSSGRENRFTRPPLKNRRSKPFPKVGRNNTSHSSDARSTSDQAHDHQESQHPQPQGGDASQVVITISSPANTLPKLNTFGTPAQLCITDQSSDSSQSNAASAANPPLNNSKEESGSSRPMPLVPIRSAAAASIRSSGQSGPQYIFNLPPMTDTTARLTSRLPPAGIDLSDLLQDDRGAHDRTRDTRARVGFLSTLAHLVIPKRTKSGI